MMDIFDASPWRQAERDPEKTAIVMADTGERLSYGAMVAGANRLARFFMRLGLKEGDTVAYFLENQPRYLEAVWGAKIAGLYYVCISRQLNDADVAYILQNAQAKVFLTSFALTTVAAAAVERLPAAPPALLMMNGVGAQFVSYEFETAGESDAMPTGRRRGASMLYSSGTTGRPKGVRFPLTDASPHTAPPRHAFLMEEYRFGSEAVLLNPGPYYHASPLRIMMHAQRVGTTTVGFARFEAEPVLRAIETHAATHGVFVPTMFTRMLNLPEETRNAVDVGSMRYAIHQAAPCPASVKERMIAWWGPVLHEMYGGSEGNGTTLINSQDWLSHKGSVGRPAKGIEVHIVGPDGEECAPYVPGLVYLGNGRSFEYFNEPEKTASVRHPKGWSTLGDIGYLDDEGFLYLTDRQSNMIISGGVNIYPQEAENVLAAHPGIYDVAVIGVPNADFGEEVKAVVVPRAAPCSKQESDALAADVIAFCRRQLSAIKCPRSVDFVESLPRSEAGKILKREVRRAYWPEDASLTA
jgi:acyl-CoA synthetase (AMP-forming)/AMP-acid ligase II